jgi:hypothetical protein
MPQGRNDEAMKGYQQFIAQKERLAADFPEYYLGIKVTHRDSEEYLKNALPPWHNVCVSYVPG